MKQYVRKFVSNCPQCVKNASRKLRPRPWGEQMVAERPGQIVVADYLYLQAESTSGDKYLLVLKDSMSHLCRLIPTSSADPMTFVKALLAWSAMSGLMEAIVTDGGTHFKCSITALLKRALGYSHHVTTSYCPWANGQIERHNAEILKILRCLCDERGWSTNRWPDILPEAEYILNTTEVKSLGNRSPIECHTGIRPRSVT